MSLFEELKRRNVFRVGIAYVIVAWLLAQVADLFLENFHAPEWVIQSVLILLVILFPLSLFFAWAFELTPDGVKKEKDIDRSQSITAHTGRKLDYAIIGILVIALGYFAWDKFSEEGPEPATVGGRSAADSHAERTPTNADSANTPVGGRSAADESLSTENSLAVLPFVNMSGDADNEFFSDGVAEEILNVLARIPELKVAARTSAFGYKGTTLNISEIARELHVANILEGSVRKSGNQVRVTAQLIKADDGFHLWSETYDRQLDNIFVIQDEIATAIAAALKVTLNLESGASGNLTGTTSLEAYEHYLQGMSLWYLRTPTNLYAAIDEFNMAIRIDPAFARAYAGLSLTWAVLPGYLAVDEDEAWAKTLENANHALKLDPQLAEPWAALGSVMNVKNDFEQSHSDFERSIELNPSFATAYQWYATGLALSGDRKSALENYQRAWELDPRSRIIGLNYAQELQANGEFDAAMEIVHAILQFAPDFPDGYSTAMLSSLMARDCAAVESYGNQLAPMLAKKSNATQVYVDLCAAPDAATRSAQAAIIAAWPDNSFSDPDSPALSYELEFASAAIEMGEFEAALTILRRLPESSIFNGGYIVGYQSINTPNGKAFRCYPGAVELFSQFEAPPFLEPMACD